MSPTQAWRSLEESQVRFLELENEERTTTCCVASRRVVSCRVVPCRVVVERTKRTPLSPSGNRSGGGSSSFRHFMTDDDGDNCRLAFVLLDFPAWIAGAMTTSISILIVNEGGNNRSAAVLVGIFVLVRPSRHLFFRA